MSRNYGNYLLLSGVLENAPGTDPIMYKFSQYVLKPYVRIIAEDCFTKLGSREYLDELIIGKRLSTTDEVIDSAKLLQLQSEGKTKVSVRSLDTCTADKGVCRKCYRGTYGVDAPDVGTLTQIVPGNTQPFFRYLAASYSGSLIGIRPLPTAKLPVRKSLLDLAITDAHIDAAFRRLRNYKAIPDNMLEFCKSTEDKLEKALFIIALYSIFSSV